MTFALPTGIRFTDDSKAYGTSFWLDGLMESTLSGDRQISGFSNTIITCTYSSSNNEVTVKNGFRFKYSDGDPPNIFFQLSNFRNPRSLAPIGEFNITMYDSSGNELFYGLSNGVC